MLYTLVELREPRTSDGSSDWPRVGRKRASMDVGAVFIQRDPIKSTMCEYLAHKANLLYDRLILRMDVPGLIIFKGEYQAKENIALCLERHY